MTSSSVSPVATHLLFVCSRNRLRSPTAATIFDALPGISAISAGLTHDADTRVSADLIEWADAILVMESEQRSKLTRAFGPLLRGVPVHVLAIPDEYEYMQPELVSLLKRRVSGRLNLDDPAI